MKKNAYELPQRDSRNFVDLLGIKDKGEKLDLEKQSEAKGL